MMLRPKEIKMRKYFIFTIISVGALFVQQMNLNKEIYKYQSENSSLKKKISFGINRHYELMKQKRIEKESLLSKIDLLSKSTDKKQYTNLIGNKSYQDGYVEGYHKALKDSVCPK